jgi:hypothetical protein
MKVVLSWLVHWTRRAGTTEFCPALVAIHSQPSTKYYFPHRTLFYFLSPHRPATWAGRRSGSPGSVSLGITRIPTIQTGGRTGSLAIQEDMRAQSAG